MRVSCDGGEVGRKQGHGRPPRPRRKRAEPRTGANAHAYETPRVRDTQGAGAARLRHRHLSTVSSRQYSCIQRGVHCPHGRARFQHLSRVHAFRRAVEGRVSCDGLTVMHRTIGLVCEVCCWSFARCRQTERRAQTAPALCRHCRVASRVCDFESRACEAVSSEL